MRKIDVIAMVVMTLILGACSSAQTVPPTTQRVPTTTTRPIPAVDLPATPPGWVPVAYGDAQVSVPSSFAVSYQASGPCGSGVFVGSAARQVPRGTYGLATTRNSPVIAWRDRVVIADDHCSVWSRSCKNFELPQTLRSSDSSAQALEAMSRQASPAMAGATSERTKAR